MIIKTKFHTPTIALQYCDTLIKLTENKKFYKYPTRGYLYKGYIFKKQLKYSESLDAYITGLSYAEQKNDDANTIALRHNIANLKITLKKDDEALSIYKKNLKFIKTRDTTGGNFRSLHISTLLMISDAYNRQFIIDSALVYEKKGIKYSLLRKPNYYYSSFLLCNGISNYHKENYQIAIDTLLKVSLPRNNPTILSVHHYLGMSYLKTGNQKSGISYLKKLDSLTNENNYSFEVRGAFSKLIDHYQSIGDQKNQLNTMKKLIRLDSIANEKYQKLNVDIAKNFDEAELIKEKNALIADIQTNNKKSIYYIIFFTVVLLCISSLIYVYILKKRKRNYQIELDKKQSLLVEIKNKNTKTSKDLDLSAEIIDDILAKLKVFESNLDFTEKKLTMAKVAKKFKTNSTYLSWIINKHKNKNFSNYLNDLRIDYCLKKIEEDRKFRNYSVKSIAEEIGFSNVQSFVTAFNKKTGVNPSDHIQSIEN